VNPPSKIVLSFWLTVSSAGAALMILRVPASPVPENN
jgi:hypothetical protein